MAPLAAQSPHRGNIIYVLHTSYRHDVIINVKMKITSCQQLPCNRLWWILVVLENANTRRPPYPNRLQPSERGQCFRQYAHTVYPKKYAHGFVVRCFVVVMQSFIMNSYEVFIHIHQGCFVGTGAIVRLPQCQWSKPDGYGKTSQCITTTKHSKANTVCIFLGIYCSFAVFFSIIIILANSSGFISMHAGLIPWPYDYPNANEEWVSTSIYRFDDAIYISIILST